MSKFKVGDLVEPENDEFMTAHYPDEISKVYTVTEIFKVSFRINHSDPRQQIRAYRYWKIAKNQIIYNILSEL